MTEHEAERLVKINKYRVRKIKNAYLVTTDHGTWIPMSAQEFKYLQRNRPAKNRMEDYEKNGLILTKKGIDAIEKKMSKRFHFLTDSPGLHIVIPTLRCNLGCDYCHSEAKNAYSKEYDMSEDTATKTVEYIMKTPAKEIIIEFQGGEPLLNFDIVRHIVELSKKINSQKDPAEKKKLAFVLVSNLTLNMDEFIDFMIKHNIQVTTSLDGPEELHNLHRQFCDGRGSYSSVVKNARLLRERGISVAMLMTTTKDSLAQPAEIVDEYVKQGMGIIQLKPMNWIGYAENKERYSHEQFVEFWKAALNRIIELYDKGVNIRERTTMIILRKILTEYDPNFLDLRSPCGAVIGQLLYDQKGDIYCCDDGKIFDIFKVGNVNSGSYPEILEDENTKALICASINDQYLCDACAYKPYCGTCPVANYAEGGTIIPKLYRNFRCKVKKAQFDYIFEKLLFEPKTANILAEWIETG